MDWSEIAAIVVPIISFMGWFWNRLDKKFQKVDERFDRIDKRFEKVDEKFKEIHLEIDEKFKEIHLEIKDVQIEIRELRTSLNRMEGAFYSKDCCILKEDKQAKKAE